MKIHSNNSLDIVFIALVGFGIWALLASVFVLAFHAQESTIFAWDFDNYPGKFRNLIESLHVNGHIATLRVVIDSLEDDYTLLPSFLLMPLGLIFGSERSVYLAGVASIYGFVALGATVLLYRSLCRIGGYTLNKTDWVVAIVCLVMLPIFWRPILRGYPDVLGMGVISGLLVVHLVRPVWARPFRHMILMGVAIAGLFWFRRWYAYFVIAAMVAVLFDFLWALSIEKSRWIMIRSLVLRGALAVGAAGLLLLSLSSHRWVDNLQISYRELYASYRSEFWEDSLYIYYRQVGMVTLGFFSLGLLFSYRAWGLRAMGFIAVFLVTGFLLFQRTQNLGSHHFYGLMPAIAVFSMAGAVGLRKWLFSTAYQTIGAILIVALFSLQLAAITTPQIWRNAGFLRAVFPEDIFPLRRNDLGEIHRLLDTLSSEIHPDEKIYVVASSYIFNGDVLRSASEKWHYGPGITRNVLFSQEVDSRDGFPWRFFTAQLVVVATPFQFHLQPSEQRNVSLLVDKITRDIPFRSRYEQLPRTYNLDDQVKLSVYRLKRPFDLGEIMPLLREYHHDKLY